MAKIYLAIDVSNLSHRAAWANRELTTSKGKFSGHVFGAVSSLLATLRNEFSDEDVKMCFCYDGKYSKEYRRTLLPTYKSNRVHGDFNPTTEVSDVLRLWPGIHIEQEDKEGDDALCYCVQMRNGKPIVVWSGDKDLWQLLQYGGVRIYSPNLKRFVENSDVLEHYHLDGRPGNIPLAKALFGDASDEIKGVFRLQKKQVAPILNTAGVKTVDDFYQAIQVKPEGMTAATYQKLQDDRAKVQVNYQVVLPQVGFDKGSVVLRQGSFDELRKALVDWECFSLLNFFPDK